MKAALLQLNSSDDPKENICTTSDLIDQAVGAGAGFVLTPEVTNCVSASRTHQRAVLCHQADDPTLLALQAKAQACGIWLLIGSLALKTLDEDGRFANRSFLIDPNGTIVADYDKIHMFDVTVSDTESYRESAGYRPGDRAVVADAGFARIGMTVCYDLRFPILYRLLAQAGAGVLTVPSAFSPVTGAAHWESLLRARAIETGCYVLAPAQTGQHRASRGPARKTYGRTLAVGPWGDILGDGETEPGMIMIDLNMDEVAKARQRIPSLMHGDQFERP